MNNQIPPINHLVHKNISIVIGLYLSVLLCPAMAYAAPTTLTYQYHHHIRTINPNKYPSWKAQEEYWVINNKEVYPLAEWRTDGDDVPPLPEGVEKRTRKNWNRLAIAQTLRDKISSTIDREPGEVIISKGGSGAITFEGIGLLGLEVNIDQAVTLTIDAMEQNVSSILLPMIEVQPKITVNSQELIDRGIQEVVTVGHSNFAGSPSNRRHNIATGLDKFNGHLIEQGSVFSFNDILGPVNARTGYKPELVILGEKNAT